MTKQIVYNNEIILNEAHDNNYLFVLDRLPTYNLLHGIETTNPGSLKDFDRLFENKEFTEAHNNELNNIALSVQDVNLPEMRIETTKIDEFGTGATRGTGKLFFGGFNINFTLDEQWFLHKMFSFWLYAAFNPLMFSKLNEKDNEEMYYVNAFLIILDNDRQKIAEFVFRDLHPASIGSILLNNNNPNKIQLPIEFMYRDYLPSDEYKIVLNKL